MEDAAFSSQFCCGTPRGRYPYRWRPHSGELPTQVSWKYLRFILSTFHARESGIFRSLSPLPAFLQISYSEMCRYHIWKPPDRNEAKAAPALIWASFKLIWTMIMKRSATSASRLLSVKVMNDILPIGRKWAMSSILLTHPPRTVSILISDNAMSHETWLRANT